MLEERRQNLAETDRGSYGYFYRNLYHHVCDAEQKNWKKNLIRIDIYSKLIQHLWRIPDFWCLELICPEALKTRIEDNIKNNWEKETMHLVHFEKNQRVLLNYWLIFTFSILYASKLNQNYHESILFCLKIEITSDLGFFLKFTFNF